MIGDAMRVDNENVSENNYEPMVNLILGYNIFVAACYLILFINPIYIENYMLGTFISMLNLILESIIIVYLTNIVLKTRSNNI